MKEYVCTGEVTLSGVVFYVKANSRQEAEEMVISGHFSEYDTALAEAIDCNMSVSTLQLNE